MIRVEHLRLTPSHPSYGAPVQCTGCGATHGALGIARIVPSRPAFEAPLCELCLRSIHGNTAVVRKFLDRRRANLRP